jgi:hypothetical protein
MDVSRVPFFLWGVYIYLECPYKLDQFLGRASSAIRFKKKKKKILNSLYEAMLYINIVMGFSEFMDTLRF